VADEVHLRKKFLLLCDKLQWQFRGVYTWLLRSSFKHCGKRVTIQFPIRLGQPGSISLGSDVLIYARSWLNVVTEWAGTKYGGEIRIGDRVCISYNAQISAAKSIVIEDDVAVSAGVVIVDHIHDHRYSGMPVFSAPLSEPAPVRIGKGSFLGVHCFVSPGVQIGEHAVICANAVVVNDVPAYSMAAGNPARIVRFQASEAEKAAARVNVNGV